VMMRYSSVGARACCPPVPLNQSALRAGWKQAIQTIFILFLLSTSLFATDTTQLRSNIQSIMDGVNARWGIYIKNIDTADEIAINADRVMETMSVIKIPILVEAFQQVHDGKFKLDERVDLNDNRRRWGTGLLQILDSDMQPTVKDYMTLMITVSDNSATDVMLEKIGGPAAVDASMKKLGLTTIHMPSTAFDWFRALASAIDPSYKTLDPAQMFKKGFPENPKADEAAWKFHAEEKNPSGLASPHEIGKLLEMIAKGQAVSGDASKQMIEIMRNQFYMSRIPHYLSNPWSVPHKTGDFPPYLANDVGILEPGKMRVIIVVFNSHYQGQYPLLEDAVAKIALETYNFYSYRQAQ